MATHWARQIKNWNLLGPPLRPHADVVARVRAMIDRPGARCLLLGTTVEYASLDLPILSMDLSLPMLSGLWRADDPSRPCVQADWTRMPIKSGTFAHVLADGSLNAVPSGLLPALLPEVRRVLQPGGMLVARVFCRPDAAETLDDVRRDVQSGKVESFHVLKWRVAMSMVGAARTTDIAVTDIRDTICALYPDRSELCRITGWNRAVVDTLDTYDGSTSVFNFPTEREIAGALRGQFGKVESIACGTYPLAERCPLLVASNPTV